MNIAFDNKDLVRPFNGIEETRYTHDPLVEKFLTKIFFVAINHWNLQKLNLYVQVKAFPEKTFNLNHVPPPRSIFNLDDLSNLRFPSTFICINLIWFMKNLIEIEALVTSSHATFARCLGESGNIACSISTAIDPNESWLKSKSLNEVNTWHELIQE